MVGNTESTWRDESMSTTRRNFLAGAAALAAAKTAPAGAVSAEHHWGDIRLAVATYSLREFSRDQAIGIVKDLGIKYVNVKSFHMPYYLSKEDLAAARAEFEKAGLTIVSGGNISLRKDDDADVKYYLEYAKNAGFPIVVCAPTHNNLGMIEKHAKRLGLKIAIHNHGPEDPLFPNARAVMDKVKNMDPLMGICYDVGHASRTGEDILEGVEMCGARLHDMHIKDLKDFSDKGSQTEVGKGKIPVVKLFQTLEKTKYPGVVGLEYEIHAEAPQDGMAQSFSYMRGVLDGMAG
jgi:sugar phosphate isomerase/epimerase